MFTSLRKLFTDTLTSYQEKRATDRVITAFEKNPTADAAQAIAAQYPKLGDGCYERALTAALATDDIAVFKPIFDMKANPNYTFNWEDAVIGRAIIANSEHILYRALKEKRYTIAATLAETPGMHVDTPSWNSMSLPGSRCGLRIRRTTTHPTPLELAKTAGLGELVEMIEKKLKAKPGAPKLALAAA